MRFEIVLLLITGFIVGNIYTDGKYLKQLLSYKKYYQMAGVVFGAFVLYWLLKKNPAKANEMIATSNEYLKYLPIDQNATSMLSPILDFTSKNYGTAAAMAGGSGAAMANSNPILNLFSSSNKAPMGEKRILNSGYSGGSGGGERIIGGIDGQKKATKRSVSETKKKYVASNQNWKCGDCGEQLSAWFEVDHKVRLEYGGSNHIDNLVALCRECHGKKTTIENL
jgi:hypothetical protein